MNKKLFVPIIIVAIIASFGAGFYVSNMSRPSVEEIKTVSNAELGKAENVDFSLFWDAWKVIEDKFVNMGRGC